MTRTRPPADYPGCPVTVTEAMAAGIDLRTPRWGLWDVVWGGIAALVLGLVAGTVLVATHASTSALILVGTTVPWIAMAGWPLLTTRLRGNGPRIDLGLQLTWPQAGWGALTGVAGLLLAGIAALITRLFQPDLTSAAADAAQQLQDQSGRVQVILFGLLVIVGAPIVEEIFFRGLFFSALRKAGVHVALTVIITALVFAGFHFEPTRFFVLLPTGILLGWVRARTGSTGSSIVAHMVVNAPGAIVLLVGIPDVSP